MRILPALLLSSLTLLGACANHWGPASTEAATTGPSCEHATVPPGAVMGVRDGLNIATYPSKVTRGMTGCQRVWYGDPGRRESMQVLATYYFQDGQVRRLVGQVPGGVSYDCQYRGGSLDVGSSRNAGQCPKTTVFDGS